MPRDLPRFVQQTLTLPNLKIVGIGSNLACYGAIKPSQTNMAELSQLVHHLERQFGLNLIVRSGGNSANYQWFKTAQSLGTINNLRLGESILLGCDTANSSAIPGLHHQAFQLVAEVIESKLKPSLPWGTVCQDAFGQVPQFGDRGPEQRTIVALGKQDIASASLKSKQQLAILGASSDHLVLGGRQPLAIGQELQFSLDYGGLLAAMTSPFVEKRFVQAKESNSA